MSTTSTVSATIDALLAAFQAAGALPAFESWPGPGDAKPEMLVLGEVTWDDYAIATIKAGRKQRQENWSIGFELFVMGAPGTTPADPAPARVRAFALLAPIENVLADDPETTPDVQWVEIRPTEAGPRVFEKGWAYRIAGRFVARARLI